MKKKLSLIFSVVALVGLLFVYCCIPASALSYSSVSYTSLYAPDMISAVHNGIYCNITPTKVFSNQGGDVNLVSLVSNRINKKTILSQQAVLDVSSYEVLGNTVDYRFQITYSGIDPSSSYYDSSVNQAPLQCANNAVRYSTFFHDKSSLDIRYNSLYIPYDASISSNVSTFNLRIQISFPNGTPDTTILNSYGNGIAQFYSASFSGEVLTDSGYLDFEYDVVPIYVGISSLTDDDVIFAYTYQVIASLKNHFKNELRVPVAVVNDTMSARNVSLKIADTLPNTSSVPDLPSLNSWCMSYTSDATNTDNFRDLGSNFNYRSHVILSPGDFVDWIGDAVGGFLTPEIVPGIALGGILSIIIAISMAVWLLKVFAGG